MFHRTVFVLIISMCLGAMAAVMLSADALTVQASRMPQSQTSIKMPSTTSTSLQKDKPEPAGQSDTALFDMPSQRLPRTIYPAR